MLTDLQVFSTYLYRALTEILGQKIQLFNSASAGTIVLRSAAHQGDYADEAFYKKITGLVRRRNAYGSGAVGSKKLEHLLDTMVKVAAGTPPVEIDPGMFRWIQRSPAEGAVVIAQQLAPDMLADMLNTAVGSCYSAIANVGATVVYDGTADVLKPVALSKGRRLFGDRSSAIRAWIVHSSPIHDFYEGNLANVERLFQYGTINVTSDPFGTVFVTTDSPSLVEADGIALGVDKYHSLGLVEGAVLVDQNNDFESNTETKNGDENINRTYQAEWSFNLGLKGYAWDKAKGGKSPNDAALFIGTNWDVYSSDVKDTAGVVVESK